MTRLQAEGLVQLEAGRGAVVISFTVKDVEDVLEARALVETFTAERSFAGRAQILPDLEVAHHDMARTRIEHDTAGFSRADREFHEQIVDAAGNAVLSAVYRSLRERQTLFTSAMVRGRDDRMAEAIAEHEKILDALRGDDLEAFVAVVAEHLTWSVALARESL
jgi:DNA-binding GntR family transcriptional regulator